MTEGKPGSTVFKDLTGQRFGRWTVETVASRGGGRKVIWNTKCDCGAVGCITACSLRNGSSTSCGCRRSEVAADNIRKRFPTPSAEESARRWDRMLARKRAWHARNPEKSKQIRERAYQKADKSYYAVATRKRKALLLQAPGSGLNHEQWVGVLEHFGGKCAYCLADATSIDHVVPLTRGGAHDVENVVPACKPCNSTKGNRSLLRLVMNGGGVV